MYYKAQRRNGANGTKGLIMTGTARPQDCKSIYRLYYF